MVDVFISYGRADKPRAEKIEAKLRQLGWDGWSDNKIRAGATFDAAIDAALREAQAVLALWSPSSVGSDWVRNEATVAKERGVLVAAMVAPCEPPLAFRSTQYAPLYQRDFSDDDPAWMQIVERIRELTNAGAEVEKLQKRIIARQRFRRTVGKIGATALALIVWLVGAVLIGAAAGAYVQSRVPVVLAGGGVDATRWDDGVVVAIGTMVMENERISIPLNERTISCNRDRGQCAVAEAFLTESSGGHLLVGNILWEELERWDEDVIIASHVECDVRISMTISRSSESVTFRRTPLSEGQSGVCLSPRRVSVIRSSLQEGAIVHRELSQAAWSAAQPWAAGALLLWSAYMLWRIFGAWRPR